MLFLEIFMDVNMSGNCQEKCELGVLSLLHAARTMALIFGICRYCAAQEQRHWQWKEAPAAQSPSPQKGVLLDAHARKLL